MSAVSPSYPISAPVEFTNTSAGDGLLFNAEGFTTGDTPTQNIIVDFATECPGDILYRNLGGTANTLEYLPIGTPGDVLAVGGSVAVAQVQTIDTVAGGAAVQSSYFLLNSPSEGYYVWYNIDAGGTDPGLMPGSDLFIPAGSAHPRNSIPVAITSGDTADVVATATRAAINLLPLIFTASGATNEVAVTNVKLGIADAVAEGAVGTGFAFNAGATTPVVTGVSPSFGWMTPAPVAPTTTFMAINTASPGTVAAGSTWVTLSNTTDTNVTWSEASPGHDAGALFDPATGIFTVPTTGIWQLSAVVSFEGDNSGNGGGGIPGRRAVRQIRIVEDPTGAPVSLAVGETQANPRNANNTQVHSTSACVSLTAADSVVVQVRHDANVSLDIGFEDDASTSAPVTYFSAHLVAA